MRRNEDNNLELPNRRSRFWIGAVIVVLIVYTITCYLIIDKNAGAVQDSKSSDKSSDRLVIITQEEFPDDIPTPEAECHTDWECGTYYSNITIGKVESYFQTLDLAGWKHPSGEAFSLKVTKGTAAYQLFKEDTLLQLITFIDGDEVPMCNGILIRVDYGIRLEDVGRQVTANRSSILPKVQLAVDNLVTAGELPTARQKLAGIFEIFIPDAFDKLELQAYAAVSDTGFSGCFLVRKGVVSYVEGDLANAVIADIDQDGGYELVDLYTTWEDGLFKYNIVAFEYENPIIFSSFTEILLKKYSSCYVPEGTNEKLTLIKKGYQIRLMGEHADYGTVLVKDGSLVPEDMEHFPYAEWSASYDQSLLQGFKKKVPRESIDINITIDGIGLDYVVHKTDCASKVSEYTKEDALKEILAKQEFIPTVSLGSFGSKEIEKTIIFDFGDSIPDYIQVADLLLDENGRQLFGGDLMSSQTVKILDSSRVSFALHQHFSLYLSSNSRDYDRDWRRLLMITCRYGEKECVYALLINTGMDQQLTRMPDHDFLECEGFYSALSSNWGLGISVQSDLLPERYIIEWQVDGGSIRSWNASTKMHNHNPATYSWDDNHGDIIWKPVSFEDSREVKVRAVIYEEDKKNAIAFDEFVLINVNGTWLKKKEDVIK